MDALKKTGWKRRGRQPGGTVLAVTALLALALAGCSSAGSQQAATSGTSGAASSPTTAATLTGTPYVFGTDSTDSSQSLSLAGAADGFEAWAAYTNAHGGILGHPVKIIRCNDQGTPDGNTACARQLIQNPSVLAVAGSESPVIAAAGEPLLSAAGLPYVCGNPLAPPEFQGSSAYCITGGPAAEYAALVSYLVGTLHIKNIVSVGIESTVGQQTTAFWAGIARQEGAKVEEVWVQAAEADYTSAVVQAQAAHAGAWMIGIDPASTARFFQAAGQVGVTVPMATVGSAVDPSVVQAASQYGGPLYYTQAAQVLDTSNPAIAGYLAQMKADGYTADIGNASVASWMTGLVLQAAIEKLGAGHVSRASLQQLLQSGSLTGVPLLPSPLSLTAAPKTFPHLANASSFIVQQQGSSSRYVSGRVTAPYFGG
jgi:branched-chain amino acid transport system substrate-binding protein